MGKASRSKRKRATVRAAKRSRSNNWWYALIALVLIAGVALIMYSNATAPGDVGPYIADQANPNNPHNKDSHWHAALGVYDCDHWVGDATGEGLWQWPVATPQGSPGRANNTNVYAGLHSHADGIIHMEPVTSEDAGRHATLGKYFEYGGWKLSSTGYEFLGTKVKNGDKCANGGAGTLQWGVAKWDGTDPPGKQKYTVKTGNPADYKLNQGDVIIVAFLPPGKTIESIGNPPSIKNLPGAAGVETAPGQMPPTAGTTPATGSGAPTPNSPTTGTPTSPTSKP
jgi:hypothetical protein